jgi:hypothetical protein
MSRLPFPLQANPPSSSHLPSMADCRLPPISGPPPGHAHATTTSYRHPPHPVPPYPLTLPPISQLNPPVVNYPPTNFSHRYLRPPPTPAPQIGSNVQARPLHAPGATSSRGAGSTSNAANAPSPTQSWIESHIRDLGVIARSDSGEEKGKAFLDVWLGLREAGLQERQSVRLFTAKKLIPYPWFMGDETIGEALNALHRLEFIHAGLLAKKHSENANWFWEKKIGDLTVREYWTEEGKKQRQRAETQANAQGRGQGQGQTQVQR